MAQVYKIVTGKDNVKSETWFTMAREGLRQTRGNAHPLSLRQERSRLEVRRNFFSQRVVDGWNKVPAVIKYVKTVNIKEYLWIKNLQWPPLSLLNLSFALESRKL